MRKHIIRILAVVLFACLGLAVLTACNVETPSPDSSYTVTYVAGGGTGTAPAVETHKEGEKFTVKANPFTYEGYTFTAWNDGTKDVAAESEYTMPAKNVTFTAKWEKVDQVTVTYALGEYTEGAVPTPTKVAKGAEFTLPAGPTWEGHLFTGWKLGEEVKKAGEKITVSENITLTAQWKAVSSAVTDYTLEKTTDAVYFVVKGTYTGYTPDEMKEALASNSTVLCTTTDTGWTYVSFAATATAENGTWALKFDITEAEMGHSYYPCADQSGSGDILWDDAYEETSVELGGKTYEFKKRTETSGGPFMMIVVSETPDPTKTHTLTDITLVQEEEKIYLIYSGTFEGYTEEQLKAYLEDATTFTFYGNGGAQGQSPASRVATIGNGTWTLKFDVTDMPDDDEYALCWKDSPYKDKFEGGTDLAHPKADDGATRIDLAIGDKTYSLIPKAWNGACRLVIKTVIPEKGTFEVTSAAIEIEAESKVIVKLTGTFEGYTKEEFDAALKDDNTTVLAFRIFLSGGDWATQDVAPIYTVGDGTFEVKFDVTDLAIQAYQIGKDYTGEADIKGLTSVEASVELGEKTYSLKGNAGNLVLTIAEKLDESVTFSDPTSLSFELADDQGNGTDENFKTAINRAFIVLKGTYTGNAVLSQAQNHFSADNYPMNFAGNNANVKVKDRMRRISIDTDAKTWTLKIEITALPVGENTCTINEQACKLTAPAEGTSVKSVGSTYTISNNADGALVVTVAHNYTVDGVKLEMVENTPCLVVNGTFEKDKFTGEEIEKFLKDEDIRTMCVTVHPYLYPSDENYHLTVAIDDNKWTAQLDLSVLQAGSYGIVTDGGGYGNLHMDNITGKLETDAQSFTFAYGSTTEPNWVYVTVEEKVKKESAFTGATIAEDGGKVILTVSGTYTGYTEDELKEHYSGFDLCLNHPGWTWQHLTHTLTASDGTFTITIDVTALELDGYSVCEDGSGVGDIKVVTCNVTVELENKIYTLTGSNGNTLTLTVKANKTIAFTGIDITVDSEAQKVYLIINGTSKGFTEEDLKAYLEGDIDGHKFFSFWGNTVQRENPASIVATVDGSNWTAKCDVTDLKFESLRNIGCPGDTKAESFSEGVQDKSVTLGSKKYTLQEKNGSSWDNVGLKVEFNGVDIGSDKHDNDFKKDPEYTDSIKKGQVLSFKGKFTSLGTQNYFAPVLFLYTAGTTPAISFRIDWWVNELNVNVGEPDTKVYDAEKWSVTKHQGPVWETFLATIKDAEVVLTVDWSSDSIIYVSFLVKGTANHVITRMVYTVVASEGALEDSYAVGIGTDHCHLVLDERSVGKVGYSLYDELAAETQLNLGSADNKTCNHYLFNSYIKKGDKIVFEGTSTAAVKDNWDANGLYLGSNIGSETWFRADNFVDGTIFSEQTPVHDVTVESWHIEKDNKGWDDWAKYKEILANCTYKLTIDWTGDAIVITMEFTAEAGTYTQTYTVTALEGATLSTQYNFGLGCCNSSASLKATTVTRA